jgi:hypothetical protein
MRVEPVNPIESIRNCGCGRSPTGRCIGWHGLTNEQYKVKLNEWESIRSTGKQLLNEESND